MYTFPQQQKIFKDLLSNNPSNKQCADCNTVGPTWASLNFGVFLCSNCSGAHRALGPTITRVKSTKLDQWQKQWMENMQIGNKQVNQYWESDLGLNKKPRMGAQQPQLIKYATQKYVKKRYVKDRSQHDPLTQYKNGTYSKSQPQQKNKQQTKLNVAQQKQQPNNNKTPQQQQVPQTNVPKLQKPNDQRSNVAVSSQSKKVDLLEFDFGQSSKLQVQSQTSQINRINGHNHHQNGGLNAMKQISQRHTISQQGNDDEQFSQFTEHGTSFTGTTTDNNAITFEQLIAKRSVDSSDSRYKMPTALHHTHSASSIPNTHYSPHFNINMNGHSHHVGGHHVGYNQNGMYNPMNTHNHNQHQYQSIGYIPPQQPIYNQQVYNSQYNQPYLMNNNVSHIGQNQTVNGLNNASYQPQNNKNYYQYNPMSNQPNQQPLNPHHQTLGGYHNQGLGSHQGQGQSTQQNKGSQFHWNDFSGLTTNQQQSTNKQVQNKTNNWINDWK